MAGVAVGKVNGSGKEAIPLMDEFARRFEGVRQRAFEVFEKRGGNVGPAIEDWIKAERETFRSPAAEFTDNGTVYELKIALPGFDVEDLQVTASPAEIVVKAATRQEKKSPEVKVLWSEFASSDFFRRFEAPHPIDAESTWATLEKGVLCITAPKETVEVEAEIISAE